MLTTITRSRLVGLWFFAVAVVVASLVVMGVNVAVSTIAILLALSVIPPGILLFLWRAPTPTVGEILYAANSPKERRP
jgi:hypothetical protein